MSARALIVCMVAAALTAALAAGAAVGDVPGYKVIVHPDNPVTSVDAGFLRDAFLKKTGEWPSGLSIRPLDLTTRSTVRTRFVREVLHKTPVQLRNYWNQQIFSGKHVPPPQVDSPGAAIAYVLANTGAVAYIPADLDAGRAKVVPIK